MSLLDINIFNEKRKFVANVYQKKTFSCVYTNINSFIPETYKTGLIKQLLLRCFSLCSHFMKFRREKNLLKSILYKKVNFIEFLDRVLTSEIVVGTVPKKDLMIVLLYLAKCSLQIFTRINGVMKK